MLTSSSPNPKSANPLPEKVGNKVILELLIQTPSVNKTPSSPSAFTECGSGI